MVAFITKNLISALPCSKRQSKVIEEDHILIVGFSERVIDIIREIVIANESDEGVIAILADMDKEEMDDYLRDHHGFASTRVITRSGSTTSLLNLRNAGIDVAHSVVVLNTAKASDSNDVKEAADAKVIKTIMAVVAARGGLRSSSRSRSPQNVIENSRKRLLKEKSPPSRSRSFSKNVGTNIEM